jgi:bacillithiol disulfide reductase
MGEMLDVMVIGAGPTGLACGIEAVKNGLRLLILEKGCLVNSIYSYPANMTFFTTRERLEIGEIPFSSANLKPTRAEALEYYRCAADYYHLPISFEQQVTAVRRSNMHFEVEAANHANQRTVRETRKVIVATGYYDRPNYLGITGENLPKVAHYALEGHAFYGRKVAVIGGANSAAIAALDLYRHGAEVTVVHRGQELSRHIKYWIRPDIDNRIKEKSISAFFESCVTEIDWDYIVVKTASGEEVKVENDFVFALTGYHPDVDLLRTAGVDVDPKTYRPASNPATLESNVPGLYLAGVVISGRNTNEIFIENGRFHGKQIIEDVRRSLREET